MKTAFYSINIFLLLTFLSCGQSEQVKEETKSTSNSDSVKTSNENIKKDTLQSSMEQFCNLEQVSYCTYIPANEYKEDFDKSDERAKHYLANIKNKKYYIEIQGFHRQNPETSFLDYYKNSFEGAEEEGKIIEKTDKFETKNCFYAKGYWSNSIYDSKFIEIYWLKKEEMVKYTCIYDIKDTTIWNERLDFLLKTDSEFKDQ